MRWEWWGGNTQEGKQDMAEHCICKVERRKKGRERVTETRERKGGIKE